MKTQKFLVLFFALFGLLLTTSSFVNAPACTTSAVVAVDEEPTHIGTATITCSSGGSGDCWEIFCDYSSYTSLFVYKCRWAFAPEYHCSLLLVKFINMGIDYLL